MHRCDTEGTKPRPTKDLVSSLVGFMMTGLSERRISRAFETESEDARESTAGKDAVRDLENHDGGNCSAGQLTSSGQAQIAPSVLAWLVVTNHNHSWVT